MAAACRGPVPISRAPVAAASRGQVPVSRVPVAAPRHGPTFRCRPVGPRCPASAAGPRRVQARAPRSRDLRWESAAGPISTSVRGPTSAVPRSRGQASAHPRSALGQMSRRGSATVPAWATSIPASAVLAWGTYRAGSRGPAPGAIVPALVDRTSANLVRAVWTVPVSGRSTVPARCRPIGHRSESLELETDRESPTGQGSAGQRRNNCPEIGRGSEAAGPASATAQVSVTGRGSAIVP